MGNYSSKLKRTLAMLMAFVMIVSVLTVAPSATVNAATKNYAKSLKVSSTKFTLAPGKSKAINATVKVSGSAKKTVKVKQDAKSKKVVTVKTGKVSKKGVTKITFTAKKNVTKKQTVSIKIQTTAKNSKKKVISKTVKITVKPASSAKPSTEPAESSTVAVTGINATINTDMINVGSVAVVSASVVPANATNKNLKFTSDAPGVAQVNEQGVVTGISSGIANITVQSEENAAAKKTFAVTVNAVSVTSVSLDHTSATIDVTGTVELHATVSPATATNKEITWTSDAPKVATVSTQGVVSGVSVGTATITAVTKDGPKATCVVTVTGSADEEQEPGVSLVVINPYEDNAGTVYNNMVLVGRDMTIRARVLNDDGQPVGNRQMTLNISSSDGNASNKFEVRNTLMTTDDNGYANFVVGLKKEYAGENAISDIYQSYKATAQDTVSQETAELTIKFASVQLSGVVVENNRNIDYPDIEPSTNASAADTGIYETSSLNEERRQEYVSSQQVSSTTSDHRVYLSAAPYLRIPAESDNTQMNDWEYKVPNGVSGKYSIYNDDSNKTTTVQVAEVPAGLQSVSVEFSKISLSKYTTLNIDAYDKATGDSIYHRELTEIANKTELSTVQIIRQRDVDMYIVVSLVSQGQVDTDAEGYIFTRICGPWKTDNVKEPELVELKNSVVWTKLSKIGYSETKSMSYNEAEQYLPADSKELNDTYKYTYEVPAFPNTGDAVITVKDSNDVVKGYYLYPSENKAGNENVIAAPQSGIYAINATEPEATTQGVGSLTTDITDGNLAVVDSAYVGLTSLQAEITVKGLNNGELNTQNGGRLYTSVQWSTVPKVETAETVPDYFAIEGQQVTITAQLYDADGKNVVKAKDENITFTYGKNNRPVVANGNIGGANNQDQVQVIRMTTTTDVNGTAILTLRGDDVAYVEDLTAVSDNYNVRLSLNGEAVEKADIYWVDLGLSFVDSAAETDHPVRTVQFEAATKEIEKHSNSAVGKTWEIGYQVIARSKAFDFEWDPNTLKLNGGFISVDNVALKYSKNDDDTTISSQNNVATISSKKVGTVTLTGKFDWDATDLSKVTFTYYDENGVVVTAQNIGNQDSSPTGINTALALVMEWSVNGRKIEVFAPNGNIVNVLSDAVVCVKVSDNYGNAIPNAVVKYTIDGESQEDQNQKTDEKGIYKIQLSAPGVDFEGNARVITVIVDDNESDTKTYTITYDKTTDKPFGIRLDDTDKSVYAVKVINANTLELFFTNAILESSLNAGQFKLTDENNINTFSVTKAEMGNNDNSVILTIDNAMQLAGQYTIGIISYIDSDAVVYDLMDTHGQKVTQDLSFNTFIPKERGLESSN